MTPTAMRSHAESRLAPAPAWVARVPVLAGASAILFGSIVLTGWIADLRELTSITPNLPSMKANTAVMAILCGIALILRTRPGRSAATAVRTIAVSVVGISGLTLAEWLTRHSLGIDQVLVHDHVSTTAAGRPAPQAALAMFFTGLILLSWGRSSARARGLHQASVSALALLTGSVLLGYLFGADSLTTAGRLSAVSVPGMVVMTALLVGALAGMADDIPLCFLWQDSFTGRLVRRMLPSILIAPPLLGYLRLLGENQGWYDLRFGLALFSGSMILTLMVIVTFTARELDRADADRELLEGRLEAIFDHVPAPMSFRGADGRYVQTNRQIGQMLGVDAAEMIGRLPSDFFPPEIAAHVDEQDAQILAEGTQVQMDEKLRTPDGVEREYQVIRFPVNDSRGEALGIGSIAMDVTELKQAETEAREAAKRFRALLDAAPDAAVIVDSLGIIQLINTRTCDLFGYDAAELVGQSVEILVPDGMRGHHAQARDKYLEQPVSRSMGAMRDLSARHKDGHEIPVEISLGPLRAESGVLVSAAIRDVTAKREAELARRAAEQLFRSSFDDAPIGMLLTSLDTNIEQVNEALLEIVGADRPAVVGSALMSLIHPTDRPGLERVLTEMVDGCTDQITIDVHLQTPVYESLECDLHASVLRADDSTPERLLIQVQDITDRRRYEAQLQHMADHDPLTGLYNRRRFESELRLHVARCKTYGAEGALVSLDLDHFKQVNDTLGHNAGDQLIISIADVLRSHLHGGDILARLGGDEFAVLMPKATQPEAKTFAETIVRSVRTSAGLFEGHHRAVTVSVGVSMFDLIREKELSGDEMLIEADVALYDAKEAGRNTYAFYADPDDRTSRTRARLKWTERIEHALDHHGFVLYGQPILDIAANEVQQYELLIRMLDDNGETIPPGAFLYVAERVGLVTRIDEWVFNRAADLVEEHPDVRLEINLSAQSLGNQPLLQTITRRLGSASVDAERIVFEVTETAAVSNITDAQNFAHTLRAYGCRFALDDFGAGFGSFYYLKHLPFDYVKIDGEFVQHALSNRMDQLIIASLVRIARGLDKRTIAEFVTNEKTLDLVRNLGVDYAQGYGVGVPVPLQQIFNDAIVD